MSTASLVQSLRQSEKASIRERIGFEADHIMASLPSCGSLSSPQRRRMIARYTAVLEGNFIYWMTGAYIAAGSEEARSIIIDNLHEEVRDSHPRMLRKFALAAHAIPTDSDSLAVDEDLTNVRLFVGKLSGVRTVTMMAFFEGFIQKFMAYLAELAAAEGSNEFEYTDVHGVCDIAHTEGLFQALWMEMTIHPEDPQAALFEGVDLLRKLLRTIIAPAQA